MEVRLDCGDVSVVVEHHGHQSVLAVSGSRIRPLTVASDTRLLDMTASSDMSAPGHYGRDAVTGKSRPVQQVGAGLVERPGACTAAGVVVSLGRVHVRLYHNGDPQAAHRVPSFPSEWARHYRSPPPIGRPYRWHERRSTQSLVVLRAARFGWFQRRNRPMATAFSADFSR